jgi:hypothetical protein
VTLIGCRDDLKEIVVVENRPVRGQSALSRWSTVARPVVEWDSELEFGCTGGVPCPLLEIARRSSEEGGSWVLESRAARVSGGYG